MTRRIIVEGPDGAGKSRLVKKLAEETGVMIAPKASRSVDGPVENLAQWVENDLDSHTKVAMIYDRHPLISELIYGPVIRGKTQFEDKGNNWLAGKLAQFYAYEPMIVYCLPSFLQVAANVDHNSGNQMPGVIYNIKALYELYWAQWARDAMRPLVWKWNYAAQFNYSHILNEVRRLRDG